MGRHGTGRRLQSVTCRLSRLRLPSRRNIVSAIDSVATKLGNTRAVCRKCYIHPAVLEAYRGGVTIKDARPETAKAHFSREEAAVVALLRGRVRHGCGEKLAA